MATRVIKISADSDVPAAAAEGARVLREGRLVGFATETVYGIAAVASNSQAMERLRDLKSRPSRPFSVHMGAPDDALRYVNPLPDEARRLIERGWPGPVTTILPTRGRLADPALSKAKLHPVLCQDDQIGLRCPDNPVCKAMLSAVPDPVVAPSANLAGQPSPRNAQEVLAALDGKIDLLLDSGPTCFGQDSTIVQFDAKGWRVVRKGVYDEAKVRGLIHRTLLFVCTGNTCRSPMAAALAVKMLCQRLSCRAAELPGRGYEVVSAGLFAADGGRATPEAARAAKALGADLSAHRSRKITRELAARCDMILCMTDFHVEEVRRLAPQAAKKVCRLDEESEIADPIGGDQDVYMQTARRIADALRRRLEAHL